MPAISDAAAETALRELDMVCAENDEEIQEVTDDVFRAREELKQVLDGKREVSVTQYIDATVTANGVTIRDKQNGEIALSGKTFQALIAEFVKAGGLDPDESPD